MNAKAAPNLLVMTDKREGSKEQWEQEIRARQQNIAPADYPEGLCYVRGDHLPKIVSQARFRLGIALIAVGIAAPIPIGVAVAAVASGVLVTITSMRLNKKR
jgi:hypothetical protein